MAIGMLATEADCGRNKVTSRPSSCHNSLKICHLKDIVKFSKVLLKLSDIVLISGFNVSGSACDFVHALQDEMFFGIKTILCPILGPNLYSFKWTVQWFKRDWMVLKLYKLDASPPNRACMMLCDLLKVPVEMVDVDVLKGEHLTPDFLKINPTHTVPVLEDGDLIINDSHAILMYLADVYGKDNTLYPKDLKQRALVNQRLFFNGTILFPRMRHITVPVIVGGSKEIPEKLLNAIDEAYGYLEEFLTRSKYVATNHVTIADIAAYATTTSLALLLKLDAKKYPKVQAWHEMMEQNPYVHRHNTAGVKLLKALIDEKLAS